MSIIRSMFLRQHGQYAGDFTIVESTSPDPRADTVREYSIGDYLEIALESPMHLDGTTFKDHLGDDKPVAQFKIAIMFSAVPDVLRATIRTPLGLMARRYQKYLKMGQVHVVTPTMIECTGQKWYMPCIDGQGRGTARSV